MATEATFTVPSEGFPLGTVFRELPGATVTLERVVPATDVVIPYFWVRGVHSEDVVAAFADHPGVRNIQLVDAVGSEYLMRAEWVAEHEGIITALAKTGIPLIEAVGTDEEWTLEVRGDDRDDIAEFQRRCREWDVPITLATLHALTPLETATEAALTDAQQEALVLAYRRGYFDSPRAVTMAELGDELGISQQAVASRIRRGIRRVLGRTIDALSA